MSCYLILIFFALKQEKNKHVVLTELSFYQGLVHVIYVDANVGYNEKETCKSQGFIPINLIFALGLQCLIPCFEAH